MRKILPVALFYVSAMFGQHNNLLVGTYTNDCKSDGIYVYDFDSGSGEFKLLGHSEKASNPSFLSVDPTKHFVYAVNENGPKSEVSSYRYDAAKGSLAFLNKVAAQGSDPCHVICDENNVLVANYSSGSVSVFGRKPDGTLTEIKQSLQHQGHSKDPRQTSPHVHQLTFSPDHKRVLANDLGTDRIYLYDYDASLEHPLSLRDTVPTRTASGPRHLTFSNDGRFVYLLQELDGTLTVFAYEGGRMRRVQETSIVEESFAGKTSAADLHFSPDGKFLYASNRGDANTITVFSVGGNGKVSRKQIIASGGKGPRNFAIDPTGKYLLVGHQYTGDIMLFSRDAQTGLLTDTGKKLEGCAPVCLVFSPRP